MAKVLDLAGLIRYVRTPLGGLLGVSALLLICLPFILHSLSSETDRIARYVVIGVVLSLVVVIVVFILRRIPKTASGLVASEDYYAYERYLSHFDVYGQKQWPGTRKSVMKAGGVRVPVQLPPAPGREDP